MVVFWEEGGRGLCFGRRGEKGSDECRKKRVGEEIECDVHV